MAALTPATLIRESAGSTTMIIATFTTVTTGDTWASGLGSNIIAMNAQPISGPTTQASTGATLINSTGTITLKPGEDGNQLMVQIWAKV